ncbi:MAG: SoxR reducing system RseC family protein [Flavobacteriaceae bacterium]|nr:SoxR reducing system RseC family protein [Muriicola sp.]MBT8291268.1 SoxR reducing system RseC family protein [Muriicola sp.]NNC63034.1 SoxR reducing system RseC family protein [Eudoraea sp.]NNK36467.1 SoxR reducing system RseC family protein [Eudoraea sp.]NNL39996.1 SoxR reducing system RseC family protein [Flavobacteriaceae bacterium]
MDLQEQGSKVFVHSGKVSKIHGKSIMVSLDKNIQCETCSVKGACGVSNSETKEIEIPNTDGSFRINEPVKVTLKKSLGQTAVFWAYIFPFLLMLLTLITASAVFTEWIAGLLSLFVLVPYYASVYAFRNYFRKTFRISVLRI